MKKKKMYNEIFNLGFGKPREMSDMIKILESNLEIKAKIIKIKNKFNENQMTYSNNKKSKKFLNWYPKISLESGLQDFVKKQFK